MDPFIGEIRLFGFPRIPNGWLACNGQQLSVAQYQTLYAVIGNTYGGADQIFNVPDLQGRVAIGQALPTYAIGQVAGEEEHTLIASEMPLHSHALMSSSNAATEITPGQTLHLGTASVNNLYAPSADAAPYDTMAACLSPAGSSMAHDNMMPSLVCNYCICFEGIFPSSG